MKCEFCHSEIDVDSLFCDQCGKKLNVTLSETPSAAPAEPSMKREEPKTYLGKLGDIFYRK
jgi:predicted amidophosphoribosyltransferase